MLDPPKKGNNLGFNLDTLDGTRIQKRAVLRRAIISLVSLGPYSGLLLHIHEYIFKSLGRNLLRIGLNYLLVPPQVLTGTYRHIAAHGHAVGLLP